MDKLKEPLIATKPMPKFKKNDIVQSSYKGNTILHIYDEPQWSDTYNTWNYPYDYGLGNTSEGFALESSLRKYKPENTSTIKTKTKTENSETYCNMDNIKK